MLLGMKGILSEVELHTIRGRLIAGVQNKARRGELALVLLAPSCMERRRPCGSSTENAHGHINNDAR